MWVPETKCGSWKPNMGPPRAQQTLTAELLLQLLLEAGGD